MACPKSGQPGWRTLGVRPGLDTPAIQAYQLVVPGEGGMSVSPHDPRNLPEDTSRPPLFQRLCGATRCGGLTKGNFPRASLTGLTRETSTTASSSLLAQ